jgi:hypothetical protein
MDKTEDVSEQLHVVRILLELHQLDIQNRKILGGFRQELTQQIVHRCGLLAGYEIGRPHVEKQACDTARRVPEND